MGACMETLRDLTRLYRALGDDTRIAALFALQRLGELCVCDMEQLLDITQSRASRHLRCLLDSGLVEDRRDGAWVFYRLADPKSPAAAAALEGLFAQLRRSAPESLRARISGWRKGRCNRTGGERT